MSLSTFWSISKKLKVFYIQNLSSTWGKNIKNRKCDSFMAYFFFNYIFKKSVYSLFAFTDSMIKIKNYTNEIILSQIVSSNLQAFLFRARCVLQCIKMCKHLIRTHIYPAGTNHRHLHTVTFLNPARFAV